MEDAPLARRERAERNCEEKPIVDQLEVRRAATQGVERPRTRLRRRRDAGTRALSDRVASTTSDSPTPASDASSEIVGER